MTRRLGALVFAIGLWGGADVMAQQPGMPAALPRGLARSATIPAQVAPAAPAPVSVNPVASNGVVYGAPVTTSVISSYPMIAPVYGSTNLPGGFIYSYYGSWTNQPRVYQSYGPFDPFPFYGQPYGHAYDRYSWEAMSGENRLARYYYPPVP